MKNKITKSKKIGILLGGLSAEKDISRLSGEAVYRALHRLGYRAVKIVVDKALPFRLKKAGISIAFNALHGKFGEDGAVQGVLEFMGIPYTGSGIAASAAAMDKVIAKHLMTSAGMLTPQYIVADGPVEYETLLRESGMNLPYIVKPSCEGSSIGITKVSSPGELAKALATAFRHDPRVLIEKFIEGRDVTVAIYGDRVLGSMEVGVDGRFNREFLDYEVKYTEGMETFSIPPSLPADVIRSVEETALGAHRLLGCSFYSRIDFRVAGGGRPYLLEVNTLPGLTSLSYVPKIAESKGMTYEKLVEGILQSASLKGRTT